jgi:hypothetical protein
VKEHPVPYPLAGRRRYIHELYPCSARRFVSPRNLTEGFDGIASIGKGKADPNHLVAHSATKQGNGQSAFTQIREKAAGVRAQVNANKRFDDSPWAAASFGRYSLIAHRKGW